MRPIAEDEILKIVYKFDKNKSAGHDGIGNLIVKGVAKEIVHPLMQPSMGTLNSPSSRIVKDLTPSRRRILRYIIFEIDES